MKIQEKHIENLSNSKKSGIRIGSRGTPHRLREYEKTKIDIALRRGYLECKSDDRINITNIWEKYGIAKKITPWIIQKDRKRGTTEISLEGQRISTIQSLEHKDIEEYIQASAKTRVGNRYE